MTAGVNRDECAAGHLTSGFVQASGAVPAQRMDPAATAADTRSLMAAAPMHTPAASPQGTDSTETAAAAGDASHHNVSAPPATDTSATTTAAAGEGNTPAGQVLLQSVAEVSAARWKAGKAYALGQEARRRQASHQSMPERLLAQVTHPPVSLVFKKKIQDTGEH